MKPKILKIKVCGMRYSENINEITLLKPDFMGFIFYDKSPRNITNEAVFQNLKLNSTIKKIGVFVNESIENIIEKVTKFDLQGVQLHGNETPEFCTKLKEKTFVIKSFSMDESFNFNILNDYKSVVNFFLFDTKGENHGGNGKKFNWDILTNYQLKIPFMLSGGIKLEDVEDILKLNHSQLFGLDINSGFEITPGLKDEKLIHEFIVKIRQKR